MRITAGALLCFLTVLNAWGQVEPDPPAPAPEPPAEAAPEPAAEAAAEPTLEEVLVTGEQPGPGLWEVRAGEHSLWVVGVQRPLPKKLVWRSKQIESLIGDSQNVLLAGSLDVDANIGFFKAVTLIPAALAVRKNPDGGTLADQVPPDVYQRWLVLKQKYLGRSNGVEKFRPTFAALELGREALDRSGLEYEDIVEPVVRKAARKHKVKLIDPTIPVKFQIDQPRAMLKQAAKVKFPDAECFAQTIDHLEADLESMRERANAWAIGDVAELNRLYKAPFVQSCAENMMRAMLASDGLAGEIGAEEMVERWKEQFTRANADLSQLWLTEAERALTNNKTTFAVLPLSEIVRPEGRLQQLVAKGYELIAPVGAQVESLQDEAREEPSP